MYVRVRHFSDGKEVETGSGILRLDKKHFIIQSSSYEDDRVTRIPQNIISYRLQDKVIENINQN